MVRSWFPLTRSRANIIKQKSHSGAVTLEDWGPQDCDPQQQRSHSREGLAQLAQQGLGPRHWGGALGCDTRAEGGTARLSPLSWVL